MEKEILFNEDTKNKIDGLIFLGSESYMGQTREIWFHYNGFLYQIITKAENDAFVGKILENIKFE